MCSMSSPSQAFFIDKKLRMLIASLQFVFLRTLWDAPVKILIVSKNICETKPNTKRNLVAHKQNGPWPRPFAGRHIFSVSKRACGRKRVTTRMAHAYNYTSTRQATTTTQLGHDTKPHHDVIVGVVTHWCVLAGHSRYPWSQEEEEAVVVSTHESLHCAHHRHK